MSAFSALHGDAVAGYPFRLKHALSVCHVTVNKFPHKIWMNVICNTLKNFHVFHGGYFLSSLQQDALNWHFFPFIKKNFHHQGLISWKPNVSIFIYLFYLFILEVPKWHVHIMLTEVYKYTFKQSNAQKFMKSIFFKCEHKMSHRELPLTFFASSY